MGKKYLIQSQKEEGTLLLMLHMIMTKSNAIWINGDKLRQLSDKGERVPFSMFIIWCTCRDKILSLEYKSKIYNMTMRAIQILVSFDA